MEQMTYFNLSIKYNRQKAFEITKDFGDENELIAWCLDHHANAKSVTFEELA